MVLEQLLSMAEKEKASRQEICIRCCMAAGCMSSRGAEIKEAIQQAVSDRDVQNQVEVRRVGCMGLCGQGPMVSVEPVGLLYQHVTPENAPSIVGALNGGVAEAELSDPQHPFFSRQTLIVCANSGRIDPERIEDYIEVGGYLTLQLTF